LLDSTSELKYSNYRCDKYSSSLKYYLSGIRFQPLSRYRLLCETPPKFSSATLFQLYFSGGHMSFTEMRFPENISYGSTGGPEFSTDVVTTHNGYEQRNINWSHARARYNIAYGVRSNEQLTELITFFNARKGKAIGFRFKDWSDFTATNQEIGIGDDKKTTFHLIKTYVSGKDKHTRTIKKPVHDTIKIYL